MTTKSGGADVETMLDIARALLDENIDPVPLALRLAERVVREGTASAILGEIIEDKECLRVLLDIITTIDHVGFLIPTDAKEIVSDAASVAGFNRTNALFPSMILARELGALSGVPIVPTTILKASGIAGNGVPLLVELFMPSGAAPKTVREWIRAGVGPHIAFCVRELVDLDRLTPIISSAGFSLPAYMREKPLTNDVEKVTTLYFDGRFRDQPLRLEFCHYA